MDLNDLHTFIAVAERGSFSGAAKELGLAKSTVSERVKALEAIKYAIDPTVME